MNPCEALEELHSTMARSPKPSRPESLDTGPRGRVVDLVPDSDSALVAAILAGRAEARRVLVDRYASELERVLYRVLGPDSELPDLLQDVFVVALGSLHRLREPAALRGWLIGIAVNKGRKCILRRRYRRFIDLVAPNELPEREARTVPFEVSEALRCTYAVLDRMPTDERVVFSLRLIDGMTLPAVADACGISLSTAKRRLTRAQRNFKALAAAYPVLEECMASAEVET